jgi:hypothetical protein
MIVLAGGFTLWTATQCEGEALVCSLRWLGAVVPANAVVLDEDKDGVEPVGARYGEVVRTSM